MTRGMENSRKRNKHTITFNEREHLHNTGKILLEQGIKRLSVRVSFYQFFKNYPKPFISKVWGVFFCKVD